MDFDIKKFDEYRENNRLEAKKAKGGLPDSLWAIYSSMANCYGGVILLGVVEKTMAALRQLVWKMWKNCGRIFGIRSIIVRR